MKQTLSTMPAETILTTARRATIDEVVKEVVRWALVVGSPGVVAWLKATSPSWTLLDLSLSVIASLAGAALILIRRESVHANRTLDLRPYRWEIDLSSPLPSVTVVLWATNYSRRECVIHPVRVPFFRAQGVIVLQNIVEASDFTIPPHSTRDILVRRLLIDSESRVLRESATESLCDADLTITAGWQTGKNAGNASAGGPYSVLGIIRGLPKRGTIPSGAVTGPGQDLPHRT